jgi:hypothetical protein
VYLQADFLFMGLFDGLKLINSKISKHSYKGSSTELASSTQSHKKITRTPKETKQIVNLINKLCLVPNRATQRNLIAGSPKQLDQ